MSITAFTVLRQLAQSILVNKTDPQALWIRIARPSILPSFRWARHGAQNFCCSCWLLSLLPVFFKLDCQGPPEIRERANRGPNHDHTGGALASAEFYNPPGHRKLDTDRQHECSPHLPYCNIALRWQGAKFTRTSIAAEVKGR